jgi:sugar phosphate isomerase/epimerase
LGIWKAKADVEGQITVTRELGLNHVELDADSQCPYLNFSAKRRREIREFAESNDVTLSLHLPYSYVGSSICCAQDEERSIAVELHKRYIDFAAGVGMKYLTIHAGNVPSYHTKGVYRERAREALIKSLIELGRFSADRGLVLCLENNTAFEKIFTELEECIEVVKEVREKGAEVYLNFDLGHWLTRGDAGKEIPAEPERVMDDIPPELMRELHLNDYIIGDQIFHPPLHLESGALKRENLRRYAEIVKKKGVEVVVLETALRDLEQVLNHRELLEAETRYVREIFGV